MSGVANIAQQLRDLVANGVSYASPMPGFAAQLTDEEIAAVINHERTLTGILLDIGQTS